MDYSIGNCGIFAANVMILRFFIGAMVGAGLGFGWYKFIGCSTGSCPIVANPFTATLYGMIVGALIAVSSN
jgi:hypothetical protein